MTHHQEKTTEAHKDLGGIVLKVASDHDDFPLIYLNDANQTDGLNVRILQAIGSIMNFTCTYSEQAPDGFWGEKLNGTWNGLLGMVAHEDYALTLNYFPVVKERVDDFGISSSYRIEGYSFALKQPAPLPSWMSLVEPFHIYSWFLTLATLFIVSIILLIFNYFIPWTKENRPASKAIEIVLQVSLVN